MASLIGRGAFADVFDLGDGTVAKIYRRTQQTHAAVSNWDDHEFIIRQLFAAETRAYEKVVAEAAFAQFVPRYFGPFDYSALALTPAKSAEHLISNCGLRLERIVGRDTKVAHVQQPLQQRIEEVLEAIRDSVGGINVWDCSCFIPGSRAEFTVIDFGLWEEWSDAQLYLEEHGSIPELARQRFRVR